MAEKESGLKRIFSKSNQDCCSVSIEAVEPANEGGRDTSEKETTSHVKKAQ